MKLVKDLGMHYPTDESIRKSRYGKYKCPSCKKIVTARTQDVKRGKSTQCRSCASKKVKL